MIGVGTFMDYTPFVEWMDSIPTGKWTDPTQTRLWIEDIPGYYYTTLSAISQLESLGSNTLNDLVTLLLLLGVFYFILF